MVDKFWQVRHDSCGGDWLDRTEGITYEQFRRYLVRHLVACEASEDDEGAVLQFKDGRTVRIFAGGEVILS
jgi:hypothetical protein